MKKRFDEVVSLGYNCETSWRIEDYFGKVNSWPFSWTFILDKKLFLNVLDDIDKIMTEKMIICEDRRIHNMVQCVDSKICFHVRPEFQNSDRSINKLVLDEAIREVKSRLDHLVDKFKKLMNNEEKSVLFIVGITDNGDMDDVEFVEHLAEKIQNMSHNRYWELAVVVPKNRMTDRMSCLQIPCVKVFKIRNFGVQKRNDVSTDSIGWAKVFGTCLGRHRLCFYFIHLLRRRIKKVVQYIGRKIIRN